MLKVRSKTEVLLMWSYLLKNIYALCGKCGKEMRIDICEFTQEGCFEPDNSQMYCPECSKSEPWKNLYSLTSPLERDDIIPALDGEG